MKTSLFPYSGGKKWLSNILPPLTEKLFQNKKEKIYIEPFGGALGSFIANSFTLKDLGVEHIILNDFNTDLYNVYCLFFNEPDFLLQHIKEIEINLNGLTVEEKRKYYYLTKDNYNNETDKRERAIDLIYLQHHCFNGIYRTNSKGEYNTSIGTIRENTNKINSNEIYELIKHLQQFKDIIELKNVSYEDINFDGAVVYLDPPYIESENKKLKSGSGMYNVNCFNNEDQLKLISKLKNCSFLYSNHYHEDLIKSFENENIKFDFITKERKNTISGVKENRQNNRTEVLIYSI